MERNFDADSENSTKLKLSSFENKCFLSNVYSLCNLESIHETHIGCLQQVFTCFSINSENMEAPNRDPFLFCHKHYMDYHFINQCNLYAAYIQQNLVLM